MPNLVIDASVYAKWFNRGEEFEDVALRLRGEFVNGRIEFHAPSHIIFETCNTIWKNPNITDADALTLTKEAVILKPEILELDQEIAEEAMRLARLENVSFYDVTYVAIAKKLAFALVTADDKQYGIAKRHVKCRHLKEGYPL